MAKKVSCYGNTKSACLTDRRRLFLYRPVSEIFIDSYISVSLHIKFHDFISSDGHSAKDIEYKWGDHGDMNLGQSIQDSLSLYNMRPLKTSSRITQYVIGEEISSKLFAKI